ncbi:MAG: hypothetical protein OEY70_15695 [Acidimicrobiia bacterium]|nr:hypothetical protein [Acidimicrobiia bacterium]
MATQTTTATTHDGVTAPILASDDAAPGVRVTIPQTQGPDLSNWDNVPEWNGIVAQLDIDTIVNHPTVQRLLTARPHP